ncbi:hypothetical protein GIB67_009165 [Kingdonia uniflora]|uniref:Polygalacturonase n=1 Tax=Kingdonia uniflora TaxID=39325 RepID=A0A7J7N2Y4_9MAGN|nr:hypothetical protein GIB67_009165 [Kingdonia uniflora]
MHLVLTGCQGAEISNVVITAPEDNPNTDGIHLGYSSNVEIFDTTIGTGDDCISIGNGTSDVKIHRVTCGPGHGIRSKKTSAVKVSNVWFIDFQESSSLEVAVEIFCSKTVACTDIHLGNVQLMSVDTKKGLPDASCYNAYETSKAPVKPPVPCFD